MTVHESSNAATAEQRYFNDFEHVMLLVPGGLVLAFQYLLIYWDFAFDHPWGLHRLKDRKTAFLYVEMSKEKARCQRSWVSVD